ncbi:hypothetical protein, partial [Rhodococcus chondri]
MHPPASTETSPTVLDALRASPVGPVLDMPLPLDVPLPTLPLPTPPASNPVTELLQSIPVPTLPDLDRLLRPLTDLGAMFGTGIVEALDPAAILGQSSRLLDTAGALGRSALDALPDSWEGETAEVAAEHGRRARVAAGELSDRGDRIGEITRAATASVERGNIELTGIAQSFVAFLTAAAPVSMTPPGQAAVVAAAVEHTQAALAVVARTRGELTGHTTAMHALTAPIPVPPPIAGARAPRPDPGALTGATADAASALASSLPASPSPASTVPTAHATGSMVGVSAATMPVGFGGGHSGGAVLGGSPVGGGTAGIGAAGAST